MKWLAVALLAAHALCAQQQVSGTVTAADTGAPLAGVKVELGQNDYAMRRAFTDAQGAFRIDDVAPGDYTTVYVKPGYRHPSPQRSIHVTAGGNPIHLEAKLLHLGSISGRVTGGGKPVKGADVRLLVVGNFVGDIQRTDAAGEFHFNDIDPGTYELTARPVKGTAPPEERDGRSFGWVRTSFPGHVVIGAGTELWGEDIPLRAVPLHRVSGRVLSPKGDALSGVVVKATPPDEFSAADFEFESRSKPDGGFEFEGLPEGDWRLAAEAQVEGAKVYVARAETVEGRDLERIDLRFVEPFTLTGKVLRTSSGTPAEKRRIGVMLAPREGGGQAPFGGTEDDGSFRIYNMPQGVYRVQPTSAGLPYYLASIQIGGRDVTGQWVEIAPGALPVTITYRADGGTVRGMVEECNGATVVLAPREPELQYAEFVRQVKCGQGGRFEIAALRPGEYYAFAFDKPIGMLEFGSFVPRWINQAVRVTVRAGEATDAGSLQVTPRSGY